MRQHHQCSAFSAAVFTIGLLFMAPLVAYGQDDSCNYDMSGATIDTAVSLAKQGDLRCAEQVLHDLLKVPSLSSLQKSRICGMLSELYYLMGRKEDDSYDAAYSQMVEALRADTAYKPETDDREFREKVFNPALQQVLRENQAASDSNSILCENYRGALKRNRILRIVSGVAAAGAVGSAIIFTGKAGDADERYDNAVATSDLNAAWDDYESNIRLRNIMIGAAGAFALTELYLWIKKPAAPEIDCSGFPREKEGTSIGLSTNGSGIQVSLKIAGL